jgi:triacylglycerol esterase/lipase EstA (alpha/beta hydrolase family)
MSIWKQIFGGNETPHVEPTETTVSLPVIAIHGANATPKSFAYIAQNSPCLDFSYINYASTDGFNNNLNNMLKIIPKSTPVFILAHSLGGLYALHIAQQRNVAAVVTISTPYGGSTIADWARFMLPNYQLFKDIGTRSTPVVQAKNMAVKAPWLQLVSTRGTVPWLKTDNDGVVTITSMTGRNDMEYRHINENHYEILASDQTVSVVNDFFLNHSNLLT